MSTPLTNPPPQGCALPVGLCCHCGWVRGPLPSTSLPARPQFVLENLSCIGGFQQGVEIPVNSQV